MQNTKQATKKMNNLTLFSCPWNAVLFGCALMICAPSTMAAQEEAQSQKSAPALTPQDIETLKAKAKSGDADAMVELGEVYYFGDDIVQDLPLAFSWFKKAADKGNMYAQYNVGICYYNGFGTPPELI